MAGLPVPAPKSSLSVGQRRLREKVAALIADGIDPPEIARKIAKGDERKAKTWRHKIRLWAAHDEYFRALLHSHAMGTLVEGLNPATAGISKRAGRGRIDGAKLLLEATGFHNPRVDHKHSGDIKIKLDIPRPVRAHEQDDPAIVDADVVED